MKPGAILGADAMDPQELQKVLGDLQKAVTESSITNYALVREDLSAIVAVAVNRRTPLRDRLKRSPGNGTACSWLKLTSMGTTPANGFFANGGLPTATQNVYKRVAASYTSLGDIVQISLFDQMAGRSFGDNKDRQIKVKTTNVARIEEWGLIWGDSDTADQFDGLNKLIVTNTVDQGSAPITTMTPINEALQKIFDAGGVPSSIVCCSRDRRKISEVIRTTSGYNIVQTVKEDGMDVTAGLVVKRFMTDFSPDPVEIVVSPHMYAGCNGNSADYGTVQPIFCLDEFSVLDDGNSIEMVDLMPLSQIELPMSNSSYKILIAEFTVMKMTSELFQARVNNCGA